MSPFLKTSEEETAIREELEETIKVRTATSLLLQDALVLENSGRNYALTHQAMFFAGFVAGTEKLSQDLAKFEQFGKIRTEYSEATKRMHQLVNDRLNTERLLAAIRMGRDDIVQSVILRSSSLTQCIYPDLEVIDQQERQIQQITTSRLREVWQRDLFFRTLTISLLIGVSITSTILFAGYMRKRLRSVEVNIHALRRGPLLGGMYGRDEIGRLQLALEWTSELITRYNDTVEPTVHPEKRYHY